jgi:hypothetical protein
MLRPRVAFVLLGIVVSVAAPRADSWGPPSEASYPFDATEQNLVLQVASGSHKGKDGAAEWRSVVIDLTDGRVQTTKEK